jgi:glycopeptide antibiotics resistance protein
MRIKLVKLVMLLVLLQSRASFAMDSYRYLHVSLNTIWYIFIGLMVVILFPFMLMAYLAWYYSNKRTNDKSSTGDGN